MIRFNNQPQQATATLGTGQASTNVWGLTNTFVSPNNGNLASQSLTVPGLSSPIATAYTWDGVNRLAKAMENASSPGAAQCSQTGSRWCRFYLYNQGGHSNAAVNSSSGGVSVNEPPGFNSNNQIAYTGSNWQYGDGRGNVTQDNALNTYSYDAENRLIQFCASGGACTTYAYDGAGRRVQSSNSNGSTVFVYDASGELAAEYATSAPALACSTCYLTVDHLGSTRVVTDDSGCAVFRQDYMPFGMNIVAQTGDPRMSAGGGPNCTGTNGYAVSGSPSDMQFAEQRQDSESGLYQFQARAFMGAPGRFMSPDPIGNFVADAGNALSWNMYSYVLNNPLRFIDPTGLECVNLDNGTQGDDGLGNPCPGA